jgi:hypothetical protein
MFFYSFHFKPDNWRSAKVRNIGVIEGNSPASDNDWEVIKSRGRVAIENWIEAQMKYRTCTIVLVGSETANRPWINYEIVKSWNKGMGVAGIHIHGLKDRYEEYSYIGRNPFDFITLGDTNEQLSSVAECYDPPGYDSKERYNWIASNIAYIVDKAISIRNKYR